MKIFSLLGKIVDDCTNSLSAFDCWEEEGRVIYSCVAKDYLESDISSIIDVENESGCFVAFKANDDCYFEIDTINEHKIGDIITNYVESLNLTDIYHRLCEEAVANAMR